MMKDKFVLVLFLFLFQSVYSQDFEEEKDSTGFFIGVNVGAFFPNHNTAYIYSGRQDVTPYGIRYIFDQPRNEQTFNDYFGSNYDLAEYPFEPRYKNTLEIGLHLGYQINPDLAIFLDFNTAQLDYEQFFTVAINDPNNQSLEPTYEQLAIIGEENRFNLNLGTQVSFYKGETSTAYFSLFGNVNDVEMQRNYIIVDDINYPIAHIAAENPNLRPGGIGYGGGGGMGFKFELNEDFSMDFYYNLFYTTTNMTEEISPRGLQNSIGARIIWAK